MVYKIYVLINVSKKFQIGMQIAGNTSDWNSSYNIKLTKRRSRAVQRRDLLK